MGWFIILVKELTDMLRDRRTIFMMVVMPLMVIPLLMTTAIKLTQSQVEKAKDKELRVAVIGETAAPELFERLSKEENFFLVTMTNADSARAMTAEQTLDGVVIIPQHFSEFVEGDKQATIRLIFKSSESLNAARRRIEAIIDQYDREIVNERIGRLQLDETIFDAIAIEREDVASTEERFAEVAGGYLPYIFIIFGFMGSIYPALDLGVGEKERGTLETILSSPASRFDIVMGKFIVIVLFSISTALLALFGVLFMVYLLPKTEMDVAGVVMDMMGPRSIFLIMSMVLPVAAFFAAVSLAISVFAKSFKEAQSMIAPLNIIIILPAMVGMLPGFKLGFVTAAIPILNLSLATKAILGGKANPILIAEVYLSLFLLAGVAIYGCVKWFNREETLFRS
ncbi:MAG TPA: ABC transporter permease [Candidatus Marinimicrobia bacterium]|nr:ABC transporter permease [Candidatus Neomarinimicrobiota bacterium]HHZ99100.1 ABC transporter permease [Candidatus Neomarinimicrobiota bacterium]HIB02250.1 ABC transporter permease [Candidatus Neomarinimicrobiota bacterium]HIB70126.1 ABC transporter permease [Candidatus Neomarinimicrobiota bacterium]HIB96280.1 ABC transporter permease [Candidatus Neomarinimicrobiota bacterium]